MRAEVMTIKIVLSEGPQDAAFLKRVLKSNGMEECKLSIGDYPLVISNYLKGLFNQSNFNGDSVLQARINFFFPAQALQAGNDEILLLFTTGGKDNHVLRKKIVKDFLSTFGNELAEKFTSDCKLKIIFNIDVDNGEISDCENMINSELNEIMKDFPGVNHMKWVEYHNIGWGLFAFAHPDTGKGRLEDLVIPLIERESGDAINGTRLFIDSIPSFKSLNGKKFKTDKEKALIGIVGQITNSGAANTTIIEKTLLINNQHIQDDKACTELYKFIAG